MREYFTTATTFSFTKDFFNQSLFKSLYINLEDFKNLIGLSNQNFVLMKWINFSIPLNQVKNCISLQL